MKIRSKIFLFIVPLTILPLGLLGIYALSSLQDAFNEQVYLDEKQLCVVTSARLERTMDDCRDALVLLSSLLQKEINKNDKLSLKNILDRQENQIKETARNLTIRHSPFIRIRIVSADGNELFISRGINSDFLLQNILKDPIFFQAVSLSYPPNRVSQFPPVIQDHKKMITTFSDPMLYHNQLKGFVFLDFNLESFTRILREFYSSKPGHYFLIDGAGNVWAEVGIPVFKTENGTIQYQKIIKTFLADPPTNFNHVSQKIGNRKIFFSSQPVKEYIAYIEPIPQERWYLGIIRSDIPLLTTFQRSKILFFAVLFAGFAIAIVGTLFISKKITNPIHKLSNTTQRISQGDLDTIIPTSSRDELGEMAKNFNRMAVDLKTLIQEKRDNASLLAIGKFSAALAHDLRNPVEGIKLLTHELNRRLDKQQTEYEIADTISQSVNKLASLIEQSLDFARYETPDYSSTDIVELMDQVISDFQLKSVQLETRYSKNIPKIQCDQVQIRRVLSNLLSNAWQACQETHDESECKITVEITTLNQHVQIILRDNGPGIAPEISNKIFDPFFSTKPGGHGLGLAMVRRIIANHSGRVRFNSNNGKGTTFVIELPL